MVVCTPYNNIFCSDRIQSDGLCHIQREEILARSQKESPGAKSIKTLIGRRVLTVKILYLEMALCVGNFLLKKNSVDKNILQC